MPNEESGQPITLDTEDTETQEVEGVDEVEEAVEEDVVAEEDNAEVEEDTAADEESSEEESEEADDDEFVDFTEWASQYGSLPENIKSEEDLMKAYIAMLPEMKRGQTEAQRLAQADALLKAQGFEGGVDDLLSGNISQRQPSTVQPRAEQQVAGDRYFAESPVKDVIDMMAKDGRITEENLPQYKALSSVVDQAVGPQFERAEQVMTVTMAELASMKKQMRDLQWKGLSEKVTKGLNRKEVDALLDRGLFKDYEAAVNYHMFNHPDRLKALQENAENRGQETGRKKLRRNKAIRKAKQSAQKAKQWDYKPYLNAYGALDDGKLNALPLADQVAMLEAFEKEQS